MSKKNSSKSDKANENISREQHLKRRKRTAALGASILAAALICVCVLIFFGVKATIGYTKSYLGQDESPQYFSGYLSPVAMFDPAPFDNVKSAGADFELETAIWAALYDGEKNGRYVITGDSEIIPVKDISSYLEKYFGDLKPEFKTFTHGNFTYTYNKKERDFYVPLTAVNSYYVPRVTHVTHKFNRYTLTVQYYSASNWGSDTQSKLSGSPEKTMTYELKANRGGYELVSIKTAQTKTVVTASSKS